MRRKEFAVSLGLATPGKGRMSREALAAIDKARAEGKVFDDDAPAPVKVERAGVRKFTEPKSTYKTTGAVAHDRDDHVMGISLRYPMDQMFEGVDSNGKKHTVNGAQACSCGYSLVGHVCHEPSALIGYPLERIRVTPKKG